MKTNTATVKALFIYSATVTSKTTLKLTKLIIPQIDLTSIILFFLSRTVSHFCGNGGRAGGAEPPGSPEIPGSYGRDGGNEALGVDKLSPPAHPSILPVRNLIHGVYLSRFA